MHLLASDWKKAQLTPANHELCAFAEKLTLQQQLMNDEDVDRLRQHGFIDAQIHDATQIVGYFNYITRIADALDVERETFVHEWEQSPPDSKARR